MSRRYQHHHQDHLLDRVDPFRAPVPARLLTGHHQYPLRLDPSRMGRRIPLLHREDRLHHCRHRAVQSLYHLSPQIYLWHSPRHQPVHHHHYLHSEDPFHARTLQDSVNHHYQDLPLDHCRYRQSHHRQDQAHWPFPNYRPDRPDPDLPRDQRP